MVKKFYDKGVANFYFYSPDSLYEQSQLVFEAIANSFSAENVEAAIPIEEGKIGNGGSNSFDKRNMLIPGGVAFIILIILLIRLKKGARAKRESDNG